MVAVSLTNSNRVTYVSREDFPEVSQYKWRIKQSHTGEYACTSIRNGRTVRTVRLHRLIAQRILGDFLLPTGMDVHHWDRDTMNNVRDNLSILEHSEHARAY